MNNNIAAAAVAVAVLGFALSAHAQTQNQPAAPVADATAAHAGLWARTVSLREFSAQGAPSLEIVAFVFKTGETVKVVQPASIGSQGPGSLLRFAIQDGRVVGMIPNDD